MVSYHDTSLFFLMALRIAINGFGRIGRNSARIIAQSYADTIELVAINDLTDTKTLAHLFHYDSLYGTFPYEVSSDEKNIYYKDKSIVVFSEKDPKNLPWKDLDIDVVLECTGVFTDTEGCNAHIVAGAKKVVLSAPAKDDMPTFVLGVNEHEYHNDIAIVSNASCTTNSLAPLVNILHEKYTIESGLLTTVHAFTQDQRLHDAPHKDLRRARNATQSIIPTSTGAAKTVAKVLPALMGKLDGISLRVPTPVVSFTDFTCMVKTPAASAEEVIEHFASTIKEKNLSHIVSLCTKPLVSIDFRGDTHSSILDTECTFVQNGHLLKICAWYDNEWGYSNRLVELAHYISKR